MTRLQQTSRVKVLALITVLCLLAGCVSPSVQAQTSEDTSPSTLSVWGSGQAATTPDRAVVTIGVESSALQASAALSQNNKQMLATIAALQKAGVPENDIQTQAVQLYSRYDPVPLPQSGAAPSASTEPSGYTALNTVQVMVRDISALGALLDAAVEAGSTRIDGIRFEVSDPAVARRQAREAAWQDAQDKAQQLAALSGLQLGHVIQIQETDSPPMDVTIQAAAGGPVPIAPGTQNLQINLNVTWQVR